MNKGFITEQTHYDNLSIIFGSDNVSKPKNSGGGSDFIVVDSPNIVTFESKTSNTDVFDAGIINIFANGEIYHASSFLTNTHISQINNSIKLNIDQVIDYTNMANTNTIPHLIDKSLWNDIKSDGKLINIPAPTLDNILLHSLMPSKNKFIKANYIIIDQNIFCVSDQPEHDPLNLIHHGACILTDDHVDKCTIRTARSGSKNGIASVSMRVQFKLKRQLPDTNVKLYS